MSNTKFRCADQRSKSQGENLELVPYLLLGTDEDGSIYIVFLEPISLY